MQVILLRRSGLSHCQARQSTHVPACQGPVKHSLGSVGWADEPEALRDSGLARRCTASIQRCEGTCARRQVPVRIDMQPHFTTDRQSTSNFQLETPLFCLPSFFFFVSI